MTRVCMNRWARRISYRLPHLWDTSSTHMWCSQIPDQGRTQHTAVLQQSDRHTAKITDNICGMTATLNPDIIILDKTGKKIRLVIELDG